MKVLNHELLDNERKLKVLNESLDLKVKQRTLELQEEKNSLELKVKERTKDLEEERESLEEKVKERTREIEAAKELLEVKVQERTEELARNVARLEGLNKSMIGREMRIIELKEQIREMEKET